MLKEEKDFFSVDMASVEGGAKKQYPKFRISSIYDFLECEKRFYLIETGKSVRGVTVQMIHGRKEHAFFEERVMALPEAFKIIDIREGFLKALELGKPVVSSEIPVKIQDHDFELFITGKIDGVEIFPIENKIKIIENKPRLSEYAVLQGLLYGYALKKILKEFCPVIALEIRNTKSQEIYANRSYQEQDDENIKIILERVKLLLHNRVSLEEMKRCSRPDCACKKVWW